MSLIKRILQRFVICAPIALATLGSAFAADPSPPLRDLTSREAPADFQADLKRLDAQLGVLEQALSSGARQIASTKVITDADAAKLAVDGQMSSYAEAMFAASKKALANARAYTDSKGVTGEVASLAAFEDLAKRHEARWKSLTSQTDPVLRAIDAGQIKDMTSDKRGSLNSPRYAEGLGSQSSDASENSAWDLSELFIGSAKANAILKCTVPCAKSALANGNWGPCAACCVNAGGVILQAWNNFQACWNDAAQYGKVKRALKRAWCIAQFVYVLA